jgi:heat shock protein HslJ
MNGSHTFALSGNRLTLTGGSGTELVFERSAVRTPEGTAWRVTGYNNGRQAVVSPLLGTELTLSFANGTLSGRTGCNTFNTGYTVQSGDRVTIRPAATTRMNCPENVMTQEREFLKALESVTRWTVEGNQLRMYRADGERAITAVAGG